MDGRTLGIYLLGRELGRGGMGSVYRAETTADGPAGPPGTVVAVKVFHPELVADERAFARCRLEAEIGREIRHEHLVRTWAIGSADLDGEPCHFMVMELIEGQNLKGLLAERGTLPEPLLYHVADQVLAALHAIHERGVVHRDLKPENIVITPDHRVLLMDLGIARREAGHDLTRVGEFVGSLAYAPPEQFAGADVGRRADLYAFGATLYELATGRSAFPETDLSALLSRKLQGDVPAPRTVNPDLDPFLDQVIATCVRREAADRFATAAELRQVLREGERGEWWRLRGAPSSERVLKRLRPDRRTPLFGRAEEMDLLKATWARAREEGAVLLIHGPSGSGKSRVLYDFLEGIAGAGGPLLAAGHGAGAGSVAYGPFVEIFGDLLGGGAGDPRARLRELLPDAPGIVDPLADFLLGGLPPDAEGGLSKEALFAAIVKVLRALAAERPLLLAIEDLQLAGQETLELFGHVARMLPGTRVLLAGLYADDELPEGSPLLELAAAAARESTAASLLVRNLEDRTTEELVRFIVRHERTVRALAPVLRSRSEGNPLVVLETLAHLEQARLLAEREDGFELVGPPDEAALPATVRDLAALKLESLDEDLREILEVASILGAEFDASLLAEVLDTKPIELLRHLTVLERKHRLVQGMGRDAFRFARRQLYEAIYGGVPEALRAEYHALVADTLLEQEEEPEGKPAYTLLFHLFHADRAPEAVPFLEPALDFMGRSFHASYAAPFLEKVADALSSAPPAKRFALAMRLWSFYELLASRPDQLRVLEGAREMAEAMGEPGPRARVHALRAGSYWYAGDYAHAGEEAQAGLDLAREAGDRKWEATCTHTVGVVAYRLGRLEECAALWREALRIRREIGDRRGEASTLQALTAVMRALGEGEALLGTMQEALAVWREIGDRRGEAGMLMTLGNHLVDAARYEEGLQHLEQAIEGQRETGALISEATALQNLGRAQEILGRIDEARASWERALRIFTDRGYPPGELSTLVMLGSALGFYGEHDLARGHLERAIALALKTGAKARLANAYREMGELLHAAGEREEGWTFFEQALAVEQELQSASSRVLTLGLAANAALREGDHERAAALLRDALPDARKGVHAPLILCRLARACRAAGDGAAEEYARETAALLEASGRAPTGDGPEMYYTLGEILGEERWYTLARELVEVRARNIRNDSHREHFLTRTWPNAEILARAQAE